MSLIFGVGYNGDGEYKAFIGGNGVPHYEVWKGMLRRCYSDRFKEKNKSYESCSVHPDWHNFQNFADWYLSHEFYGLGYELDKDILVQGNREYSSTTCCLVPRQLNLLIQKPQKKSSKLPVGVTKAARGGKYMARIRMYGQYKSLGNFETPELAGKKYKEKKESYVKEVVRSWEGLISEDVYQAFVGWELKQDER